MHFSMSRSSRITLLLVIDVVFFFVELIVGYAVGSLALVADSFHMLNDVLSLIVALYAIKLTAKTEVDARYSYGWHRAEILAALVNGVFLLALCFSIFLEAIERFFSTPNISNPRLVVIVGCLGLASNIVGLFLFHEHDHSHDHGHSDGTTTPSDPIDATPEQTLNDSLRKSSQEARTRSESFTDNLGHPAATRASFVQMAKASSPAPGDDVSGASSEDTVETDEHTPLLNRDAQLYPENGPHHGHSHGGSMNMRALLLHVLGDALGNVGVIATGLVIWLTSWSFKYYFDPIVSLVITVIIFHTALPLVRSTSAILLQGVPPSVSLDDVRFAILSVEGVLAVHELHIWQLSESKVVASVHVTASRKHDFMPVAVNIREVLHHRGVHSCTIQPEYYAQVPEENLKTSADSSCLILCPPDQACNPQENACCPPPSADV